MQINANFPYVGNATLVYPAATIERLKKKCFRGRTQRLAGNFLHWASLEDMFRDKFVQSQFFEDVATVWKNGAGELGTNSVMFECDAVVGWENTDNLEKYHPDELEAFNPTPKSSGLRVKNSLGGRKAPTTSDITVVYQLKKGNDGLPVVLIWSVYPGYDIGELRGDVTKNERRVFFDWNHPGE